MKKIILWVLFCISILFSFYCALALLQAGSIYSTERALFNLKFWGVLLFLGIFSSLIAAVLALKQSKSSTSSHQ